MLVWITVELTFWILVEVFFFFFYHEYLSIRLNFLLEKNPKPSEVFYTGEMQFTTSTKRINQVANYKYV